MKLTRHAGNAVLIRGACLSLLAALVLAWCMVGLGFGAPGLASLFSGKFARLLQSHLDFLMMSGLLFGFYAAKVPLPATVRWAAVVGAFTNSSLFLAMAIFPVLDSQNPPPGLLPELFRPYTLASILITSYGFGRGAVLILKASFLSDAEAQTLPPC